MTFETVRETFSKTGFAKHWNDPTEAGHLKIAFARAKTMHDLLVVAVTYNNVVGVKYVIIKNELYPREYPLDINDKNGLCLTIAASRGFSEIIDTLVGGGAHVTVNDNLAIIHASRHGELDAVRRLAYFGADPHAKGGEPMMRAARSGNIALVDFLVSLSANPRMNDDNPLQGASAEGHVELVLHLIKCYSADPRSRDYSSLYYAAQNGRAAVVSVLLGYAVPNTKVLQKCISGATPECAELLCGYETLCNDFTHKL